VNTVPVILPTFDYPPQHPSFAKVMELLGKDRCHMVPRVPRYPGGTCYSATSHFASQNGGGPVYGWMIEWVPNVYIRMMHHAVWRAPDGRLFDITHAQNRPSPPSSLTTFVVDEREKPDVNNVARIDNRHLMLVTDPDVDGALESYLKNNFFRRQRYFLDLDFRAGRLSRRKYEIQVAEADKQTDASFDKLHDYNAIIRARYF